MLKKKKLTCLLVLSFFILGFTANARTYYISNSGNDSNSGTDASSPWQTLNKVNSFNGFAPGDNILFRRGDTFYGSIVVTNSGSGGNPITYGAYGSGAKPIITGFINITSWNNLGGNIWESSDAVSSLPYTNMVAVNGVNKAMGRYPNSTGPNTGYLYIKSHSGNSSITGDGLGSNNWAGAGIIIRKERWALERGTINSQSGNTINYTDPGIDNPQDGFGFFIQNDPKTLDVDGEWYYNPSNRKLRIYSTSRPGDVKIATVENLVSMDRKSYILFDNLAFIGSNSDALYCANYGSNLTVQNCDISFAGMSGIWCIMANAFIQNNSVKDANYLGIYTTETNANIQSNNLSNINVLEGMDQELTSAGAIATVGANTTIQYNQITNCGYSGIRFGGPNTKIANNFINRFCLIKEDGGGIDMSSRDRAKGSLIDANIVLNGIGAKYGTSDTTLSDFGGIFIDAFGTGITISNNTIANTVAAGIKLHGANNIIVRNNTTYNNGSNSWTKGGLELMSDPAFPIRNITSQGNILVARTNQQFSFFYRPDSNDPNVIRSFGTATNNYYVKPIDQSTAILINHTNYDVSGWKSFFGGDDGSNGSPKNITNPNDLRFEYNASSSSKTIQLDANYIDVKNVSYNGSITLAPYTSAVLIRNGALTKNNTAPVANVGEDRVIDLPKNSITLPGSGTDEDGSVVSYSWSQISGPSAAMLVNPNSAQAGAGDLVVGVYQFQLKVTDDQGATATATLKVTVQSENSVSNVSPVANVGQDRIIDLPKNSVVLPGSGTDEDGSVVSYLWSQISGPSTAMLVNPNSAQAGAGDLEAGAYQFQLKVTDDQGATATATLKVTVNSGLSLSTPNIPPVANVDEDRVIDLPKNSIVLPGSGTDADGSVVSYSWSQISGPSTAILVNPNSAQAGAGDLVAGAYQFQLKVTDDKGATGSAILKVTVNSENSIPNIPPVANVDEDRVIDLPKNSIVLPGSGTDADGSIVSYLWSQVSGPSTAILVSPNSARAGAGNLVAGIYQFQLKVMDDKGATGSAVLKVTVNSENSVPNIPPVANVDEDRVIELPKNSIVLPGSGTDADGSVASYSWSQISGPSTAILVSPNSARAGAGNLVAGIYQFQLKVMDDKGATGSATLKVTVVQPGGITQMRRIDTSATDNSTMSINDLSSESQPAQLKVAITAYPNPFTNWIIVNITGDAGSYSLSLADALGRTLWTKKGNKSAGTYQETINTSNVESGMYFLTVIQNNKASTIKMKK